MAPQEYEALSREEWLQRMGALFYKAVVISLVRKQALARETVSDVADPTGEDPPHGTVVLAAGS